MSVPDSHTDSPVEATLNPERVAVLGAGSWGTALTISLARQGHEVALWARRAEAAQQMRETRLNQPYLPGATLPDSVLVTADLAEAVRGRPLWVMATPAQAMRTLAESCQSFAHEGLILASVAKGIEQETLLTTTQVLADVLAAQVPEAQMGVLYGPSHAEEVSAGQPTTLVAAAPSLDVTHHLQAVFMTQSLRVYANRDVLGVEIGGSVKNVLAIAAGICDGVGYGDNAKAALITRGIAEIRRLGLAMGAQADTFAGLSGMGDLIVTCMSQHSRNRHLGEQIGRGRTLREVLDAMDMVAEGVPTTHAVHALAARHQVEMPIVESVHRILFEAHRPADAVEELMSRSAKHEGWLPDRFQ
ncbi:MAG: NAD(P)H-dependent glycerol-3-phosphate dehydrogenase [Bacteroidota bacterium]